MLSGYGDHSPGRFGHVDTVRTRPRPAGRVGRWAGTATGVRPPGRHRTGLPRLIVEFAYGDIHARPGLDADKRELVIIGVLIGLGGLETQVEAHVGSALSAGVDPTEIVETIMQAAPYAGIPRTLAAMSVARKVFDARRLLPVPSHTKE